jgi:hypothetical protein
MEAMLAKVIVPSFELRGYTLEESIAYLNGLAASHGVSDRVTFELWKRAQPPQQFHARITLRNPTVPAARLSRESNGPFTLALKGVDLGEASKYVADLAECLIAQQGRTILFVPGADGTFDPFSRRSFRLVSGEAPFFEELRKAGLGADVRRPLEGMGVTFYDGTKAMVSGRTLVVVNTTAQLDLIETFVGREAVPSLIDRLRWFAGSVWNRARGRPSDLN